MRKKHKLDFSKYTSFVDLALKPHKIKLFFKSNPKRMKEKKTTLYRVGDTITEKETISSGFKTVTQQYIPRGL